MTTLTLTDIASGSDLESATVNSIFAEIEAFLNGSTANADITITGVMTAGEFQTAADGSVAGADGAYTFGAGDDAGILWDGTDVVIDAQSALTNTPQYYNLQHTTSGTPAAGIGVGIKAVVETSASNNEIGGILEFVSTSVTATSEAFDLVLKLMAGGAAAAEKFRITSAGHLTTTSLNLSSSTTVSSVLDEDDMSSDSATALATQQSIKAYVDSQISASGDLQAVMTAGNTYYVASNDGNPEFRMGATDAEELHIQTVYDSGAQTLDYVLFQTDAASATADKGLYRFNVDGTAILDIDDGGINLAASKGVSIAGTDIITDAAGTATLSNIDAIDATTEATIEAAIDTLPNLTAATSLTSIGTLTTLTVDDITINGNAITSGGASALTITALAGQAVTVESVSFDGGVVTGASSITSTTFVGALTGDVTGNVSGTAATVTGAAQAAITSLGTLTTLTVDDITINGNAITSGGASALTITALAGQAVTVESVSFDGGVVTGASSITSTAFVGDLTGNADTATSSTTAGTVTTAAQPNITSVGTLTALTTSGVYSQDDTTDSTSGTTGSIHTDGGIGAVKDIVGDSDIYTVAWTDYSSTSTVSGFSSTTIKKIYYKKIGTLVFVQYDISGTSNSTSFTFTLPYACNASVRAQFAQGLTLNNGSSQANSGRGDLPESSSTMTLYTDHATTGWTASNTKRSIGEFWYHVT